MIKDESEVILEWFRTLYRLHMDKRPVPTGNDEAGGVVDIQVPRYFSGLLGERQRIGIDVCQRIERILQFLPKSRT